MTASSMLRVVTTVGFIVAMPAMTLADVHVTPDRPIEGQTLTFTMTDELDTEGSGTATFAPGTLVSRTISIVDSNPAAGFQWTPDTAGLWEVAWGETRKTVVIGRRSIPLAGLLVLLVAASSLIFLSVWGLWRKS
jgi:hypothetical protein